MPDERLEIAQRFFQDYFNGRVQDAVELLEPDAEYVAPGAREPSGTFVGREAVARHLERFLDLAGRAVDVLSWEDWLVGTTYVGGVVRVELQRTGRAQEFRLLFLVGVSQGMKIARVECFFSDPASVARFFSW